MSNCPEFRSKKTAFSESQCDLPIPGLEEFASLRLLHLDQHCIQRYFVSIAHVGLCAFIYTYNYINTICICVLPLIFIYINKSRRPKFRGCQVQLCSAHHFETCTCQQCYTCCSLNGSGQHLATSSRSTLSLHTWLGYVGLQNEAKEVQRTWINYKTLYKFTYLTNWEGLTMTLNEWSLWFL